MKDAKFMSIKILYCLKDRRNSLIKGMCLLENNKKLYTWKDLRRFRTRFPFEEKPFIESESKWIEVVGHFTKSGSIIVDCLLVNC